MADLVPESAHTAPIMVTGIETPPTNLSAMDTDVETPPTAHTQTSAPAPVPVPMPAPVPVPVQARYVPPALRRGAAEAEKQGAALDADTQSAGAAANDDQDSLPPWACVFWARNGVCRYGDECKYSHEFSCGGGGSGVAGPIAAPVSALSAPTPAPAPAPAPAPTPAPAPAPAPALAPALAPAPAPAPAPPRDYEAALAASDARAAQAESRIGHAIQLAMQAEVHVKLADARVKQAEERAQQIELQLETKKWEIAAATREQEVALARAQQLQVQLEAAVRANASLLARSQLVERFFGRWTGEHEGTKQAQGGGAGGQQAGDNGEAEAHAKNERIAELEAKLAASKREHEKALGRALRAEMKNPR